MRFRLEDVGERDLLRVNGGTALYLKALGLYDKWPSAKMAESRGTGECTGTSRRSASPADAVEGLPESSPPADAEAGLLEGG